MNSHGIVFLGLSLSACAGAIEFPPIQGTLHNPHGVNLTGATISMRIECHEPGRGSCGNRTRIAPVDPRTGAFSLPRLVVGPALATRPPSDRFIHRSDGSSVYTGWGKLYDVFTDVSFPQAADHRVVHNLRLRGWEFRPGSEVTEILLRRMPAVFSHLTVLPQSGTRLMYRTELPPEVGEPRQGRRNFHVLYQKIYSFAEPVDEERDHGFQHWFSFHEAEPDKTNVYLALLLPPMLHVLVGAPERYGAAPQAETRVFVYFERGAASLPSPTGYVQRGSVEYRGPYSPAIDIPENEARIRY